MSVSGVAPSHGTPVAYTPPTAQKAAEAKSPQKVAADNVTISKLAQQLASDGDTQAQELKESGAEKASEAANKKA